MDGTPAATRSARPSRLAAWARQHGGAWRTCAHYFRRDAVNALLTVLVIGIALALPAGLYVIYDGTVSAAARLNLAPQATLFLRGTVAAPEGAALAARLRADPRVAEAVFVDRAAALAEFKAGSGLGAVLDALPDNPLPHVVTLTLRRGSPAERESLLSGLRGAAEVAETHYDLIWIARLEAFSALLGRGVSGLGALLGLGVVLIAGNAIRVGIERQRDEIEVAKLCGATDAYVRRPFLYLGAAFGLGSGLTALLILALLFGRLAGPLGDLAGLYGLAPGAIGLGPGPGAALLGLSLTLGWLGGWLAVSLHLREMEPSAR
ncbi:MAG: cell division protein FtsX [Gammaproteobacteria bacterium]|nr:cell division protein FtsX [Gammaproteobacteria bacterium]MBI5616348.1 cell division protein FtsX [Gammaproteobacteria bacterium]